MKRTPALLAAVLMLVALAACGSDEPTQEPAESAPATPAPATSEPYYGDADGDGVIAGANNDGLLPGFEGQGGLVMSMAENETVERDVLGGSWDDPAQRWEILDDAINEWTPTNNPYPTLPSHPQRIVGWATLTLDAVNLDEAHEYAGHAQIHVDVTALALAPT
ncbi:hypothetical protein [Ornithinimicrobium sp. INDO-MA30-4]|uniref:hypothetical protein n=1 Tax=Ornithinimicrobium sp. INDO-MA30-4 TaxID=2908651 RepID=UPI001F37E8B2|nr:hypothetical protein [Ornithinimicrobium sp. INDO-MA30-4]UJH69760.1 hypothetical protein L0A91_10715 [Ornithinimicrobium sp. INDO-MA30-4]